MKDSVCKCEHEAEMHYRYDESELERFTCFGYPCDCKKFRPANKTRDERDD